jgi:hypothetical protein
MYSTHHHMHDGSMAREPKQSCCLPHGCHSSSARGKEMGMIRIKKTSSRIIQRKWGTGGLQAWHGERTASARAVVPSLP